MWCVFCILCGLSTKQRVDEPVLPAACPELSGFPLCETAAAVSNTACDHGRCLPARIFDAGLENLLGAGILRHCCVDGA